MIGWSEKTEIGFRDLVLGIHFPNHSYFERQQSHNRFFFTTKTTCCGRYAAKKQTKKTLF